MPNLTLWPEWAHAVRFFNKRVENRGNPPPRALIGQRLAIHAGKHIGGRAAKVAARDGLYAVARMASDEGLNLVIPNRASLAIAGEEARPVVCSAIVATAKIGRVFQPGAKRAPWHVPSEFGWQLDDVVVLRWPLTGIKGAQGLWSFTDDSHADKRVTAARLRDELRTRELLSRGFEVCNAGGVRLCDLGATRTLIGANAQRLALRSRGVTPSVRVTGERRALTGEEFVALLEHERRLDARARAEARAA